MSLYLHLGNDELSGLSALCATEITAGWTGNDELLRIACNRFLGLLLGNGFYGCFLRYCF